MATITFAPADRTTDQRAGLGRPNQLTPLAKEITADLMSFCSRDGPSSRVQTAQSQVHNQQQNDFAANQRNIATPAAVGMMTLGRNTQGSGQTTVSSACAPCAV